MKKVKLPQRKISGGIIFLIVAVLIYAVVLIINPQIASSSFASLISLFKSVWAILLFVFVVLFLINLFVKPEKIEKHLGQTSGIKGWFYTLGASAIISVPPYVLYPILGDLKKHGMKNSLIAAFMYNRNIQIAFVPAMIYYFGLRYTIIFAFYIILFSIVSGFIVGKLASK